MALEFIFTVFVVLLAVFLVHKMLQEAVDLAHIVVSVAGILVVVLTVVTVSDAIGFMRKFPSSENLVVVRDQGSVVFAAVVKADSYEPLPESDVQNISSYLASKDYKRALGSNYKLVLAERSMLNFSDGQIDVSSFREIFSSPSLLLSEYRKGNIWVYPEPLSFRIIRYIPGPSSFGFFRDAYDKAAGFVKNES